MIEPHQRVIPRQKRAQERVEKILIATRALLKSGGFESLTTNHVADKAGVPIGSVYRYFPDKDALVAALIDAHTERMLNLLDEKIAALAEAPLHVGARSYVTEMLTLHAEDPRLHQVLYSQTPRMKALGRVVDLNAAARQRVRAYFDLHRDEITVVDLDLAAFILTTAVEAITHQALRDHATEFNPQALADEITALVLGYLQSGKKGGQK
jgi:AcrR family transcriptional regulator